MTAPVVSYDLEIVESEFQANTYETSTQWTPDVLGLPNGGYVVAYSNGVINGGVEIRLDFYGADGQLVKGNVQAYNPAYSTSSGGPPSLTQLDNGNVLVTWDENVSGHVGIQAAIFSPTGDVVVSEFQLDYVGTDVLPQVTALEEGGFVVTYASSSGGIYFKVFDDTGEFENVGGSDISVGGADSEPVITALDDGGFVITWTHNNGFTYDVVARIFDADGTPREVNGSTNPFIVGTSGDNTQPAVTALPNGNFAVAYTDNGWGNEDTGITLTIVGPDGAIVNPYVHVNTPSDPGNESDPDITVLVNGFIVVSWTDPAGNNEIMGRIFDQDGVPIDLFGGAPLPLSDSPGSEDIKSAVSGILAGQFITAWQDNATDGDGGQISAVVTELVRHTDGTSGADTLIGDELRDVINGEAGDDTLIGGGGKDTLDGGTNVDTADYSDKTASVAVTLNGANFVTVSIGGLAEDTIKNIENVTGGSAADTLTGDNLANALSGGGNADLLSGGNGNDTLKGGLGNDTLNGGGNTDTADYRDKASAINVTLDGGHYVSVTVGGVAEDSIKNIENVYGGTNNDRITGDAGDNFLYGYSGDDVLKGGLGADQLDGYTGLDTADYRDKTASVAVTLDGSNFVTVSVGGVAEDSIRRVERVYGGSAADTLVGDAAANLFCGGGGNDALTGNGASDIFLFNTTLNAATNLDHLTDFTTLDEIDLDDAVFTALSGGTLAATAFYSAAGATSAHDADDRIVYNSTNGALYYDADGNKAGGVAPIEFAVVDTHAALTNADFVVV